ncbi:MAG: SDR family NAD(P)-dependent oxidoreductase [Methylococcaceae bacterium]|nr:SDR family NAD(P)-dependent oxidoreductase [Methylococcaceae bacterium]
MELSNNNSNNIDIAVVGIGCHYPGSRSALELWENIICKKQQFRRMLDKRLPLSEYYDPDKSVEDKIYSTQAAYIDGFNFDWVKRRIPKKTFEGTDIVQWLAVETADKALKDAGYTRETVPNEGTGVILGNSLTGEQTRSNNLRLRWPFVRKAMLQTANALGMEEKQINRFVASCEQVYKSAFPEVDEDTLQGGLSNTIAGRVANYFDLDGGGYVVDGACSSSLLAVCTAASQLVNSELDMALAGGVDISLDTFELIGFAKTGALTEKQMNVYDKRGKGFIPGEGCGFVVLKRLADAEREGDKIYSVIKGWGISSDGKGGITAPSAAGQSKALIKAYRKAGYSPNSLDFIEGHGTGTALGDLTELKGIALAMNAFGNPDLRACGMTSLKSILGHTKAAAGIAAFIKASIALNRRIIPPTAGCIEPHPVFSKEANCLYPVINGRKSNNVTMRCGISAMGFGGINSHITLEVSPAIPSLDKLAPSLNEEVLLASYQDSEVFLFNAETREQLSQTLTAQAKDAKLISLSELVDYSAFLQQQLLSVQKALIKVAIIANTADELARAMLEVNEKLMTGEIPQTGSWTSINQNIYVATSSSKPKVAFLFSGQGSHFLSMGKTLIHRFPWAAELVSMADKIATVELGHTISPYIFKDVDRVNDDQQRKQWLKELSDTTIAQPAICLISLMYLRLLKELGVTPDNVCGHSLGELTAFHAAGIYDEETLLTLACQRGRILAESSGKQDGAMASLNCSVSIANELINQVTGYITVANLNSPTQTIVSGDEQSIKQIIDIAKDKAIDAVLLPVSGAFHSEHMISGAKKFADCIPEIDNWKTTTSLYSSIDGECLDAQIDIKHHLSSQIIKQVNFIELSKNLVAISDVLIEVGPGRILSNLVEQNINIPGKCLPVAPSISADQSLNKIVAKLFVLGIPLNIDLLFINRLVRPYLPVSEKNFIENPCQRPLTNPSVEYTSNEKPSFSESLMKNLNFDLEQQKFDDYMKTRGNFIADIIKADIANSTNLQPKLIENSEHFETVHNVIAEKIAPKSSNSIAISISNEQQVISLVAEATGFPAESINLNMRLLDDLNLDSIKSGQLVGKIFRETQLNEGLDPASFSNSTLDEILTVIKQGLPADEVEAEQTATALPNSSSVEDLLINKVSALTGYPLESISAESRLLDDLNLDSIKSGQLIAEFIRHYGIAEAVEVQNYSNSTISEIVALVVATTLDTNIKPSQSRVENKAELLPPKTNSKQNVNIDDSLLPNNVTQSDSSGRVRNFVIEYELDSNSDSKASDLTHLNGQSILVLADSIEEITLASKFNEIGKMNNIQFLLRKYDDITSLATNEFAISKVIAILPKSKTDDLLKLESLRLNVEKIHGVLKVAQRFNCTDVSYIQFGGGYFGELSSEPLTQNTSVTGFARSVFLEMPTINIRVLDFSKELASETVVTNSLHELKKPGLTIAGYNNADQRVVPSVKVHEPEMMESRKIVWGNEDVILITGGAKGITFECVMSIAENTSAKIALVGSSKMTKDYQTATDEISINLRRLEAFGVECRYYDCDLVDKNQVENLISVISTELGAITGIVHGAGINKMRLVNQVSPEQALQEIEPKIMGMRHILDVIMEQNLNVPKLIVGFSSIIGVTGMTGNAWYAYSNETLNLMLREYAAANTTTQVVSLAYSVWGEVGMGHRLGVIKNLDKSGVGAIPTVQGVNRFWQLFKKSSGHQQVIIAGSLAGLQTWQQMLEMIPDVKSNRFIETINHYDFGLSLCAEAKLTVNKDLYLLDHNFRGSYLFPTVLGLEAMTQTACLIANQQPDDIIGFSEISLTRPIVVAVDQGETIHINAYRDDKDAFANLNVKVDICCAQTGYKSVHFSAIVHFGQQQSPYSEVIPSHKMLPINPKDDLYGDYLFQGALFQRMDRIYKVSNEEVIFSCVARENVPQDLNGFAEHNTFELLLGDAFYRDVLLQSVQLPATPNIVLPISIGKIEFYGNIKQRSGQMLVKASLKQQDGKDYVWDVTVTNSSGYVIERLIDYRVRTVNDPNSKDNPSIDDLIKQKKSVVQPLKKQLANSVASLMGEYASEMIAVSIENCDDIARLSLQKRRELEEPMVSRALCQLKHTFFDTDIKIELARTSNGKPIISTALYRDIDVSISHDKDLCMVVVGTDAQGCDIEPVEKRSLQTWKDLLGSRRLHLIDKLLKIDSCLEYSATRIWVASEAAAKALGHWDFTLGIESVNDQRIVFEILGDALAHQVITTLFSLPGFEDRMLGLVVHTHAISKRHAA